MPYTDLEKKRTYHREYMRRKRAGVKPTPPPVLNPKSCQEPMGQQTVNHCFDPARPHTVESRYPWPAYLVQDGFWFDPDTGALVGEVK